MSAEVGPEHATVREMADFKLEVERRFGRVEKLILGGVIANGLIATVLGTGQVSPAQVAQVVTGLI